MPASNRLNLLRACLACALWLAPQSAAWAADPPWRPNVLFLTTDGMSCDSVGAFGCKLPNTTPNMDRLAAREAYMARVEN